MTELEIVLLVVSLMLLLMNIGLMTVVAFLFGALGRSADGDD